MLNDIFVELYMLILNSKFDPILDSYFASYPLWIFLIHAGQIPWWKIFKCAIYTPWDKEKFNSCIIFHIMIKIGTGNRLQLGSNSHASSEIIKAKFQLICWANYGRAYDKCFFAYLRLSETLLLSPRWNACLATLVEYILSPTQHM